MWGHAKDILSIPGALKATLDIINYFRTGQPSAAQADDAINKLGSVKSALERFAVDALELTAYKDLHAMTNQLNIDLRQTFATIGPDPARAKAHFSEFNFEIQQEFLTLWEGQRAGNQLDGLRNTPELLQHLKKLPPTVREKVAAPPWHQNLSNLLLQAQAECENFRNFYRTVEQLRGLNIALNNYADHQIKKGVKEFDSLMDNLRAELERA